MAILAELLRGLPVFAREGDPRLIGPTAEVWPEERGAVARAVAKRQNEYFATRHLARSALADMGLQMTAILNNADRSPRWPDGVIGSLSHTDGWCGVALARAAGPIRGIGIDLERQGSVSPEVALRILSQRELVASSPGDVTIRFSAKEAYYKAIYPFVRRFVGFGEVEVELFPEAGSFRVLPTSDELRASVQSLQIHGRFLSDGALCCTAVVLSEGVEPPPWLDLVTGR